MAAELPEQEIRALAYETAAWAVREGIAGKMWFCPFVAGNEEDMVRIHERMEQPARWMDRRAEKIWNGQG